jgi:hypothetical protein
MQHGDSCSAFSARVRINLWPGDSFHLDTAGQKSVDLSCGDYASILVLSGPAELINTNRRSIAPALSQVAGRELMTGRSNSARLVFYGASLDTWAHVPYLFETVNCGDGPQKLVALATWHGPTASDEILRFVSG